jgi:exonuclease III
MNYCNFLVWNTRGLNSQAHCIVVRVFIALERASVVCLQETKVVDSLLLAAASVA